VFLQPRPYSAVVAVVTAAAFAIADLRPLLAQAQPQQPAVQPRPPTVTIQECRELDDPQVRARIRELTESVLTREIGQIDYAALVERYWREARLSERIDVEVDEAIRAARAETSILDRAYSTISKETAEKTAIAVAERAYNSEGFRSALSDLAQGVGRDFGRTIEGAAGRVAGPVIACVQSALQNRYGAAVAQVFARETEGNIKVGPEVGGARVDQTDLLIEGAGTIAGVALIVSRRIIAQMVTGIGRRMAGLVASRIVSTFTGLVGLALIARDLYEASEGIFPLISERMKSEEAKTLIKAEIVKSISADLGQQLSTIADETADRIYSFWLDFKQKYNTLLALSDKNAAFAEFLRNRKLDQLGRLGEIVALVLRQEGEPGVFRRTEDGSLGRALLDLDERGVAIAVDAQSLDTALAWSRLAGRRLERVVDLGLHRILAPSDVTDQELATLLDFEDRNAALRVARLAAGARQAILSLPAQNAKDLARRLSEEELGALAVYNTRLQPAASSRLLRAVVADPAVMRSLSSRAVQNSILQSQDQIGALNMLLRQNEALSIANIASDLALVREGQVHYRVFLERYWVAIAVMLLIALILVLWLRRLLFSRPQQIVVKTADGGGGRR
jgi:hypothetical protein